jgi:hypothetical protein
MVPDNDWTSGIKGFKTAAPGKLHTGWIYYGVAWLLDGRVCWSGNPVDWNVRIY